MAGDTDLDVLIDPERMDQAYAIFSELGCRRARVATARNEPGLEDFFGIDPREGKLVHFHVHWRLATGERHLKRFRLPWEKLVLDTRVRDEGTGTYVTAPAAEVVLCALRAALKLRWRDRLKLVVTRRPPAALRDELAWLMKGTDEAEVRAVAQQWLGRRGADAVERCVAEGASIRSLEHLHRVARRRLRTQASHASAPAALVRWRRELAWFQRGVARHYAPRPTLHGRGGGTGGLIVAVLGADGSGKSTLVGDLRRWFAPKFDTYPVYFGSGDGRASLLRLPLNLARRRLLGGKAAVARANAERAAGPSRHLRRQHQHGQGGLGAHVGPREGPQAGAGDAGSHPWPAGDHRPLAAEPGAREYRRTAARGLASVAEQVEAFAGRAGGPALRGRRAVPTRIWSSDCASTRPPRWDGGRTTGSPTSPGASTW